MKEYINTRLKELIKLVDEFDRILTTNADAMRTIMTSIASRKRNEDITYKDVTKDLIEVQEKHYNNYFMEQSMKNYIASIKELNLAAEKAEIKLDLSEDEKMKLNFLNENNTDIYELRNNKIEISNMEVYQKIMDGIKSKVTAEESLKQVFNSVAVS